MFFIIEAIHNLFVNISLVSELATLNQVQEDIQEETAMEQAITADLKDQVTASYEATTPFSVLVSRTLSNDWRGWDKELTGYQNQYAGSAMLGMLPTLFGGKPDGISITRIGKTGKLRFAIQHRKAPVYAVVYGKRKTSDADLAMGMDVPMSWLNRGQFEALIKRIHFVKKVDETYASLPVIPVLTKLMLLAKDRELFTAALETLTRYPNYHMDVRFDFEGRPVVVADYMARSYEYLLKDEHVIKGFYAASGTDSVYGWYQDGGFYGMEAPKKVSARMRLVMTHDTTPIGVREFFVMEDVPAGLKPLFIQGNGYAPASVLERLGVMRWVNESLKCTTMPHLAGWHAVLGEETLISKSGWKGGLNGVIKQLTGKSVQAMAAMSDMDREILLEMHKSERAIPFNGTTYYVKGWCVTAPVNVSNFFVLHGLRSIESEEGDIINEELMTDRSFYLEALSNIRSNPQFDLIGFIIDRLKGRVLRYSAHRMQVKVQEMVNVGFSYGRNTRDLFIQRVLEQSVRYMRASAKEALNLQTGHVECEIYDLARFVKVRQAIFDGMRVPVGSFDPNHPQYAAQGVSNVQQRLDWLLYGMHTKQVSWTGLLVGGPKKLVVADKEFYIPSGETMKQYVFDEDGSVRKFFSGPAQAFLLLMVASSYSSTHWEFNQVAHQVDLQSALLGENLDNFTVRGTHKLILPGFWLKQDEVACTDVRGFIRHNNRVTFSKMPVLFDKAVSDQTIKTYLPKRHFGEMSDRLNFALAPAVFVSNELLLSHQNDCDGDLGRIMDLGGICPLFDGLTTSMQDWKANYTEGEMDLVMKWKDYSFFDKDAITEAVRDCATNKEYVGKGTNDVFALSHWLEFVSAKGFISEEDARLMRNAYTMQFQNDIVRGMKHESNGDFKEMAFTAMFSNETFDERIAAQSAFMDAIQSQVGVSMDAQVKLVLETLREKADPAFLLAARRQRSIMNVKLEECHVERTFKVLDMITNSFLSAVQSNKPEYGYLNAPSSKLQAKVSEVMGNLDAYTSKYLLLGQDLTAQQSVTLGMLLKVWKEMYREEAIVSLNTISVPASIEAPIEVTAEQVKVKAEVIPFLTVTGLEGIVPPSLLK